MEMGDWSRNWYNFLERICTGSSTGFSLWNNNEPNQLGNEDYAHITPELGSQVPGMIYRILETLIQIALITLKAILLSTAGCPETNNTNFC
jgi:hypothetical protein